MFKSFYNLHPQANTALKLYSSSGKRQFSSEKLSIKQLLKRIDPSKITTLPAHKLQFTQRISFHHPPMLMPMEHKPSSRKDNYGSRLYIRDENFYNNAIGELQRLKSNGEIENTVFMNYTGHEGPIAAALAQYKIPCTWQIHVEDESNITNRILGQLQDWSSLISSSEIKPNLNSYGVILEPNHGSNDSPTTSICTDLLEPPNTLEQNGKVRLVIFSEHYKGRRIPLEKFNPPDLDFKSYLIQANDLGINIQIIGVDPDNRLDK